jgi:hypothetical protein
MPAKKKNEERNLFSGSIKNRQGIIIAGYIGKTESRLKDIEYKDYR